MAEEARSKRPQSTALVSDGGSMAAGMPGGFHDDPPPPIPVASKPLPAILPPPPTPGSEKGSMQVSAQNSLQTLVEDDDASTASRGGRPNSMISQFNKLKNQFSKKGLGGAAPGAGLLPGSGTGSTSVSTPDYAGQSRPAPNPSGHVTPLTNISASFPLDLVMAQLTGKQTRTSRTRSRRAGPRRAGLCGTASRCRRCASPSTRATATLPARRATSCTSAPSGTSRCTPHPVCLPSSPAERSLTPVRADVPNLEKLAEAKRDVLGRFISVIRALGTVYALPPTSLHVFYDVAGSLIAFNSAGSLFCNLRYYEAWRAYFRAYHHG
jgi:hypothetical protein